MHAGLLKKIPTVIGMAALLTPLYLHAQIQQTYSAQEIAMVPEYCKYTQVWRERTDGGKYPERVKQWYTIFGATSSDQGIFDAMHHYCWGLTEVNYAKFWVHTAQERKFRFESSIREFDWVIQRSRPDEKMLPEFLTKKGESLVALGRGQSALPEFERAIELKPDYWPPYAAISDYYKGIGNTKLAREALERGLSSAPDARALSRRLAELGGTKGKPAIATQPQKKPAAVPQPAPEKAPVPTPTNETPQPPAEK